MLYEVITLDRPDHPAGRHRAQRRRRRHQEQHDPGRQGRRPVPALAPRHPDPAHPLPGAGHRAGAVVRGVLGISVLGAGCAASPAFIQCG